jgi:hypothetical protein
VHNVGQWLRVKGSRNCRKDGYMKYNWSLSIKVLRIAGKMGTYGMLGI